MERLRVVGIDADASVPQESGWTVWLHMNRQPTDDERAVIRVAWGRFRENDEPPVVNLPSFDGADVRIRVSSPEALTVVVPKLQQVLTLVHEEAGKLAEKREANKQRVREVAAAIDWQA